MLPLVGHGYQFMGTDQARMAAIQEHGRQALKHGGTTVTWLGYSMFVSIADPVQAEWILRTCLEKDDAFKLGRCFTGDVLAIAPVPIWRQRRKIFTPNFSPRMLNQFVEVFYRQSSVLADRLKNVANTGPFQLWSYIIRFTMDSLFESTLGIQAHAQTDPNQPLLKAFKPVGPLFSSRMSQPWLHSEVVYKMLPAYSKFLKAKSAVYSVVEQYVKSKRQDLKSKPKAGSFRTLLDTLLQVSEDGSGLSDEEIQGEVVGLYIAGIDTSATTIGFVLHMLARYPEVQDKVYEELKEVLKDLTKPIVAEDLPHLKYLEVVIKETLRLYPPAPIIARQITEDITVPSGYHLVGGTSVIVHIWALHRNPAYWGADAEQFRPERFLTPLTHPAQFMPFSYGPRNCIGSQYAMMSIKTALATVLRRYRVLHARGQSGDAGTVAPLRVRFDVVIKDMDRFTLQLDSRK
ncbi:cytochrome P450 4d2-like [Pectinophora gossypiella]|uniref:cytochrome P450 4d2-like n=1 Tax=Pectinophora gossypiella TaxID=13191 RepID=UPI00214E578D|nr:cytochrome P450 4d2-like [Pectinophora gossypiella]